MKECTTILGPKPGNTSIILAGVHGNEPCGVKAIEKLLPKLKIKRGKVIFLLGNPDALDENVRFIEQNLNRMFAESNRDYTSKEKGSYEYKRAKFIKMFLKDASALLDIHSTRNECIPFVFAEKNAFNIVKYFPKEVKRIVSNINELEPGGTDGYMLESGKIGICVECGQHQSKKAEKVALKSIIAFLECRGHIDGHRKKTSKKECITMRSIYITKTNSFKLSKKFTDFEEIRKGQLIGMDGTKEIRSSKDCLIVFAHDCNKIGSEAFLTATLT